MSRKRKGIHPFNERVSFRWTDPDYRGGRPRKTTPGSGDGIVSVAPARQTRRALLPRFTAHLAEMGLVPSNGAGWAPVKRPERLRATYGTQHGMRYHVHADRLHGRL